LRTGPAPQAAAQASLAADSSVIAVARRIVVIPQTLEQGYDNPAVAAENS
jgi:hypothetical protein